MLKVYSPTTLVEIGRDRPASFDHDSRRVPHYYRIEGLQPHCLVGQVVGDLSYCARLGIEFFRIDAHLKRCIA